MGMHDFELRFRLHCDASGEHIYGWEVLQNCMKTSCSSRLLEMFINKLIMEKIGNREDRVLFNCLEGGIGTTRKIRNITRKLNTTQNRDYSEVILRAESSEDKTRIWMESEVRKLACAMCAAINEFLGGEALVDSFIVLTDTLSSDEESSNYEDDESDNDSSS
tara:strand:+ start:625 stop:1113 length:489 start_codon:yes stop_codon:yes gene_type:complete